MSEKWYVSRNDKVRGPFTRAAMRALAHQRKLLKSDYIKTEDDPEWLRAEGHVWLWEDLGRSALSAKLSSFTLITLLLPAVAAFLIGCGVFGRARTVMDEISGGICLLSSTILWAGAAVCTTLERILRQRNED